MIDEIEARRVGLNLLRQMSKVGDMLVDARGIRGWLGAMGWGCLVKLGAMAAGVHISLVVHERGDGDDGDEDPVEPIVRDSVPEAEQRMDLH